MLKDEILKDYETKVLPYWKKLMDQENGGFYGFVDFDLKIYKDAEKGVILNSRILWFFSNAYLMKKDEELLIYAKHAYEFMLNKCMDRKNGGLYWMLSYDGSVKEDMKHTYNQAFAIYALSAYYEAFKVQEALNYAMELFHKVEDTCTDEYGYLEAFTIDWKPICNEKLSENGLIADKTMNTLLHLLEAYTQLFKVTNSLSVRAKLIKILMLFQTKVFNPDKKRLEVFFDKNMNSITDLHSYGHDIEASWLLDEACKVLGDEKISKVTRSYTSILVDTILKQALENGSINNENFLGEVDKTRVWWVQAEGVVGFYNAYEYTGNEVYLETAKQIWEYIHTYFVDKREGGEWFWDLDESRSPQSKKPITEPWKCPYHNGRMCFEINRRMRNV